PLRPTLVDACMARRYNDRGAIHMFCPYCRTSLPEGSRFCSSCGKTMPAAPADARLNPGSAAGEQPPNAETTTTERRRPVVGGLIDASPPQVGPSAPHPVPSPRTEWPVE